MVLATFPVLLGGISIQFMAVIPHIWERCPFLEHVQSIANSYLNLYQNDRRVFKTEEIMFRNSHVAMGVGLAVRFGRKNYLLEPDPDVHCVAKGSKCGVKLHDYCFEAWWTV